jgi:hypothetical protein
MKGNKTMEQAKQQRLIRDITIDRVTPCSNCGSIPMLFKKADGSLSVKCPGCDAEARFSMRKYSALADRILRTIWNIQCTQGIISETAKKVVGFDNQYYGVYSSYDFYLLGVFSNYQEAIDFMIDCLDDKDDKATTLYQMKNDKLEWIMTSEQLIEN